MSESSRLAAVAAAAAAAATADVDKLNTVANSRGTRQAATKGKIITQRVTEALNMSEKD
jgi:hypothetical protein